MLKAITNTEHIHDIYCSNAVPQSVMTAKAFVIGTPI
jgi:hypothetical protein